MARRYQANSIAIMVPGTGTGTSTVAVASQRSPSRTVNVCTRVPGTVYRWSRHERIWNEDGIRWNFPYLSLSLLGREVGLVVIIGETKTRLRWWNFAPSLVIADTASMLAFLPSLQFHSVVLSIADFSFERTCRENDVDEQKGVKQSKAKIGGTWQGQTLSTF